MITRAKVQNFRSLRDLDLELGPINVLVGPNMAGKSNVMDVFKFLFDLLHQTPGQPSGLWSALNARGTGTDLLWNGPASRSFSISLEGSQWGEPAVTWKYSIYVAALPTGGLQIQAENFTLTRGGEERELLTQRGTALFAKNFDGVERGGVPIGSESVLERLGRNPDWDGAFLFSLIESWRFYQLVPGLMRQPNQTGAGAVLDRVGSNVSAWLMWMQTHHPEQFAKVSQAACDLLPGFSGLFTTPTAQGTVFLSSRESGLAERVNLWQMSDGELALLALLSLIYSPTEWASSLYCIDEPENHLYPKLLAALVRLLRQEREDAAERGLPLPQLILATQSPHLVDQFSVDELIWLQKKDGATRAVRPRDKENLRQLVSDKELGLAEIVYSGILSHPE